MLNRSSLESSEIGLSSATSFILIATLFAGALSGYFFPSIGDQLGKLVDYTILLLISLLFFGIRFGAILRAAGNWRFLGIALVANFIFVPIIGYAVASLFLFKYPLFFVGLVIYFMAPCTDWFLGFTRLSGGNVALGTALIPINMIVQFLLYPIYLELFIQQIVDVNIGMIFSNIFQWFIMPLTVAIVLQQILRISLKQKQFENLLNHADKTTFWLIGALVFEIFAANVNTIMLHHAVFTLMLLAIFAFFFLTFLLSESISHLFRLAYAERALLTMTVAARNAPLMLVITMAALPEQPLIYAALVIGMMMEFPYLTILRRLLLSMRPRFEEKHKDISTKIASNN